MNLFVRKVHLDHERSMVQYSDSYWKGSLVMLNPDRVVPEGWLSKVNEMNRRFHGYLLPNSS